MLKRLFALFLSLICLVSLAACDEEPAAPTPETDTTPALVEMDQQTKHYKTELRDGNIIVTYEDGYELNAGRFLDFAVVCRIDENGVCRAYSVDALSEPEIFAMIYGEDVKRVRVNDPLIEFYCAYFNGKPYSNAAIGLPRFIASVMALEIPAATAEGVPITHLPGGAFSNYRQLIRVTIPASITTIEGAPFQNVTKLKDIYYNGTQAAWNAIEKAEGWDAGLPDYTVHCTDGDITVTGGAQP